MLFHVNDAEFHVLVEVHTLKVIVSPLAIRMLSAKVKVSLFTAISIKSE